MDGPGLSPGEQRSLHEIEEMLQEEAPGLDRRLRTLDPAGHRPAWRAVCRGEIAVALGTVALSLLIVGVRLASTAAVWAFAVLWVLTVAVTFGVVCRWAGERRAGTVRRPPPRGRGPA
ncbi:MULTISPECIES: DUF3040 domain-containing protein [Streptomycetaceae]|uniref:DUF3040 domain-containing protein n=1 Tax=Streptantibioticus cattleyicolor (strain ATCC 35852 / DSM 46488 / JCM 4925 / NBRC 14057 / NRRL 8057) TaxID=1003195 RepID=F8JU36_STREN|nr:MULTISPECIES: DUF3040 domain-containing protein [Streptomycetaceae]AEW93048.1 hypothetical protein SCATT_06770 [Streptantibioticus cattleyicolor NRRL 8057 = DSM 46488]MYS57781.1 DUF3040 domain-containing protein [Streptomyces sp. SID5468]CCB73406.1 putative Predicted protein [Streptantibioticus cattleyicolor NRRL 8057 = DSM 46488]